MSERFECNQCGLCCQNLLLSDLYSELDRGDGICKYFVEETRLCSIYETRPLKCNVNAYYDKFLSKMMSRAQWHKINRDICYKLAK